MYVINNNNGIKGNTEHYRSLKLATDVSNRYGFNLIMKRWPMNYLLENKSHLKEYKKKLIN